MSIDNYVINNGLTISIKKSQSACDLWNIVFADKFVNYSFFSQKKKSPVKTVVKYCKIVI